MITTHACKAKVAKRANACARIEQEICWLDVSVDDPSRMYVAQCAKHTPEVRLDAIEGYITKELLIRRVSSILMH